MLTRFQRIATVDDRALLKASLGSPRSFFNEWGRSLLAHAIIVGIGCVVIALLMSRTLALLTAVLYLGFELARGTIWAAFREWQAIRLENQRHDQLAAAVASIESVHVTRVESETVVSVPHDFGTLYLFDLGDGRWFAYEATRPCARWPNSAFELLRLPGMHDEFGPICHGRQLPVTESLEFKDFDFEKIPGDGVVAGIVIPFGRGRPSSS